MTEKVEAIKNLPARSHLKLWLDYRWYIPVDATGRCIGNCNEGSLGFVLQLKPSDETSKRQKALKIPRLLGETHRENAYICDLMEQELEAVQKAYEEEGGSLGLLHADVSRGSPLRTPISTEGGPPSAGEWHGAIILICYEKGANPRFCLVKKVNDEPNPGIKFFPEESDCPVKTVEIFDQIKAAATKNQVNWHHPVLLESKKPIDAANILSLQQALERDPIAETWHTCLPAILYDWADGTLQESISLGRRGQQWGVKEHLLLIKNLCKGVRTLHGKNMLHADLRGANAVFQDSPENPDNYVLSDYGSFAKSGARTADRAAKGETFTGPLLGGERSSAFYAPERRAGREREAADTVVIINPKNGTRLFIILGWKTELIDTEQWQPKWSKEEYLNFIETPNQQAVGSTFLQVGDRIQIRDYVFELVKPEWFKDNKQVIECDKKFWQVYHGRISVPCEDILPEFAWFPISRTIELLKWSAATDLYSLGALALYSVYCGAEHQMPVTPTGVVEEKQSDVRADKNLTVSSDIVKNDLGSNMEEEKFREMLNHLASPSYFNTIWTELEWVRLKLEGRLSDKDLNAVKFAQADFKWYAGHSAPKENTDTPDLRAAAVEITTRITQTAPGTRQLVAAFDFNLGSFIFFIHFVFCCLHRQEDMLPEQKPEWMQIWPFCKTRLDEPIRAGAAAQALQRLEQIEEVIISNRLLEGMKSTPDEIPDYDPRPDAEIRIERQRLQGNLQKTQAQLDAVFAKISQALDIAKPSSKQILRRLTGDDSLARIEQFLADALVIPVSTDQNID